MPILPPTTTRCKGHEPQRGDRRLPAWCDRRQSCKRHVAITYEPASTNVQRHPGLCVAGGPDYFIPLNSMEIH